MKNLGFFLRFFCKSDPWLIGRLVLIAPGRGLSRPRQDFLSLDTGCLIRPQSPATY